MNPDYSGYGNEEPIYLSTLESQFTARAQEPVAADQLKRNNVEQPFNNKSNLVAKLTEGINQVQLDGHQTINRPPPIDTVTTTSDATPGDLIYKTTYGKNLTEPRAKVSSNTITFYQTEPTYTSGKLITTSNEYLLWGIKMGLLRVFHKFNFKNAVMKGHKQQITDVKFHPNTPNLVASASRDRSLILWQVNERKQPQDAPVGAAPPSKETTGVTYKILLYLRAQQAQTYFKRIEWKSASENELFAVTSENEIVHLNLDQLTLSAQVVNDIRFLNFNSSIPGARVLLPASSVQVNDIRISPDGKFLAAASESGKIFTWSVETLELLNEQQIHQTSIFSVHFCKADPSSSSPAVITGTLNNTQFTCHTLTNGQYLKSHQVTIHNEDTSAPQYTNTVEYEPTSSCLFVASMDTNTLIVLHLDDQYKIDHVAEFESNHAIVSFKSMVKYDDQENNHMIGLFCLEKEAVTLVSITLTDVLSNIYAKLRTTTYTKLSTAVPQPHAQSTSSPIKSSPSPPLNAQQPPKDNSQQQSTRQVKSPIAATQPTSPIVTPSPRSLSTPSQFQSSPITQSKSQPPLPQEIIATTTSTPSSSTAATSIPSPSPKSNQTIPTNQLHQPIPHTPSPRASQSKTQTPIETENENSTNNELLRELKKMEKRLLNRMEETIEKQTQKQYDQLYKNLERERLLRVKEEREKQEELLDTIAKAICQDIPNEVIGAMQNQILPQIGDELEQRLDQQLNNALQKQFERLGPLVESSIVTSAKQPIHESFQQVLKGTVIPAFQLSCQKMFSQISQTFESGMEERVKKPLRDHYVALNQETLSLIDQHLKQFADAHSPVMIQQAASGGLGAHASNIGGAHDGVVVNKKEQITNLIRSSAFENAFMIALSSQDLDLVLFTCEATNADTCLVQLSQPVLLSLLQQLSYELSGEKLNLKLDWIEKVLLSLDPSHYSINTHSHDILSSVLASLQKLFAKADQSKKSKVKMLIYVVHSQLSAPPGHKE